MGRETFWMSNHNLEGLCDRLKGLRTALENAARDGVETCYPTLFLIDAILGPEGEDAQEEGASVPPDQD